MDLLSHFPYESPREIQARALQVLGESWEKYDVFVLSAPTAFGKTAVAETLMRALRSVSVITPTNLLVDQFRAEFPATPSLSRLDSYRCEEWQSPCSSVRGRLKSFCKGCPAAKDMATAKYRRGPGVYNYHIYLAHKIYRDVLVVDEAHNLIPQIQERNSVRIWQHDAKYPHNMFRPDQMLAWVHGLSAATRRKPKIQMLEAALTSARPEHVVSRRKEEFNGKGTVRGEPEERDCLRLIPVDVSTAPPLFWPSEVSKIVLLSATINRKDIEALGLNRKRVLYINCESPIPAERRPIVAEPVVAVTRGNMDQAADELSAYIEWLASHHHGEKGVIHATYQLSGLLSQRLSGSRYIFHSRENKREQYLAFRDSPPEEGRILVACGMYEGIDLPDDLGRWQVIAKVPWPSLGDPAVKYRSEQDPEWYLWETWRIVMQACGRICRTPSDFGSSFLPDSSFSRLLREGIHLVPQWYRDGLKAGEEYNK